MNLIRKAVLAESEKSQFSRSDANAWKRFDEDIEKRIEYLEHVFGNYASGSRAHEIAKEASGKTNPYKRIRATLKVLREEFEELQYEVGVAIEMDQNQN